MATDREGTPVEVGDLVEIHGYPASGKEVVAVADAGVFVNWGHGHAMFLRDADRSYTSLGKRL